MIVYMSRKKFELVLEQLIIITSTEITDDNGYLVSIPTSNPQNLEKDILNLLGKWNNVEYQLR